MTRIARITLSLALLLSPVAAQAHPGHLTEVAGHGHWLGAAALGAAIAIGLWQALKGRRRDEAEEAEAEATEGAEPQDA
ncbi:hypothetical protein ATO6_06870 [Oceanicola sp. 22II-s10i]|uniref:DUF6732 family protein n=1 Tax=Oceanicola sp. 22II-s10i TaxID=1317116 RepID=UPI000B51EEB9|nr:DUF6732 family protein [Oceanicola sp. 22II-s10i]OWU86516.1 hypothetical protein ATO6_06870 [Oceanicola sp. 22II-s10i]